MFYYYCVDNIYDWRIVEDKIDIGRGKWILIGDKATPYDVATKIIFVYMKKVEVVVIYDDICMRLYFYNMDICIGLIIVG